MNNVKKILLMEDDYDIAALLRLNLQDEGYQIVHEADGARARLLLDKQTWDAVILNLWLNVRLQFIYRIPALSTENLYPFPQTVWIIFGSAASCSILARRRLICVLTVCSYPSC